MTLGACGSWLGIGYHPEDTPFSLGVTIPLDRLGLEGKEVVYYQVQIETEPAAAEVWLEEQLIGSTPMLLSIPFEKGTLGKVKGSVQILLKRNGYFPEGRRIFPLDKSRISFSPGGRPVEKIHFRLRPK